MKIEGNVFFITGGASGLGEGLSRALVQRGGRVMIVDRDDERGVALAKELGQDALFANVDVTKEDTIKAAINATVKKMGRHPRRHQLCRDRRRSKSNIERTDSFTASFRPDTWHQLEWDVQRDPLSRQSDVESERAQP